jgi:hypothetical protein
VRDKFCLFVSFFIIILVGYVFLLAFARWFTRRIRGTMTVLLFYFTPVVLIYFFVLMIMSLSKATSHYTQQDPSECHYGYYISFTSIVLGLIVLMIGGSIACCCSCCDCEGARNPQRIFAGFDCLSDSMCKSCVTRDDLEAQTENDLRRSSSRIEDLTCDLENCEFSLPSVSGTESIMAGQQHPPPYQAVHDVRTQDSFVNVESSSEPATQSPPSSFESESKNDDLEPPGYTPPVISLS